MTLNQTQEHSGPGDDLEGEKYRAMAMGWLQRAREGRMRMPTVEGMVEPTHGGIEPEGLLALFWWKKHPSLNPVVVIFDTPTHRMVYWEVPGRDAAGWNDYWADRFANDAERLDREMNRGEEGQQVAAFSLGTIADVADFIEGSLRAYEKSTH